MQKRSIFLLVTALLLLQVAALNAQEDTAADSIQPRVYPLIPTEAIGDALSGIKITASDIGFRTDYVEVDSFRLPLVDSLTRNPLAMAEVTEQFADLLLDDSISLEQFFIRAANTIIRPSEDSRMLLYEMVAEVFFGEAIGRPSPHNSSEYRLPEEYFRNRYSLPGSDVHTDI